MNAALNEIDLLKICQNAAASYLATPSRRDLAAACNRLSFDPGRCLLRAGESVASQVLAFLDPN